MPFSVESWRWVGLTVSTFPWCSSVSQVRCCDAAVCVSERAGQLEDSAELVVQEDVSAALVLMVTVSWSSPHTLLCNIWLICFPFSPNTRTSMSWLNGGLVSAIMVQVRGLLLVLRLGAEQLRAAGEEPVMSNGR